MTQDEIIRFAIQCGLVTSDNREDVYMDALAEFAKLVAAKEREACAKVCETLGVHPALNVWDGGPDWYKHGKDCAASIRKRGQA